MLIKARLLPASVKRDSETIIIKAKESNTTFKPNIPAIF